MKNRIVVVNNTKKVIQPSGWAKKGLASEHIELSALCGFGCRYCSSNNTPWMRIHSAQFLADTVRQLGEPLTPKANPELAYVWKESIVYSLEAELYGKRQTYGAGRTLALSQSTDPLSPVVEPKVLEEVLRLLVRKTSFRVRILTKNAQIGSDYWIGVLKQYGRRVVVSLSTGTLDAEWSSRVEIGTSTPAARLRALRALQDAGVPTYGMLCPVFPGLVDRVEDLIDAIRPDKCEHIWAEPFNDRDNWQVVQAGYEPGTDEHAWFDRAFGLEKEPDLWSDYAATLYKKLRLRAEREGWLEKLRYMLYEANVSKGHAAKYYDLRGVMLQSIDKLGRSTNPEFRALQEKAKITAWDRIIDDDEREVDPDPVFLREPILMPCSRLQGCTI